MASGLVEALITARGLPCGRWVSQWLVSRAGGDEPEAMEFCRTVASDPAVASAVLRFANAGWEGGGEAVATIREAVGRIGIRTTRVVALSSVLTAVEDGEEAVSSALHGIWSLGLAREVVARRLAEHVVPARWGEVSQASLLAHVSVVALSRVALGSLEAVACAQGEGPERAISAEREALGMSAFEASARLLRSWRAPRRLWGLLEAGGAEAGGEADWLSRGRAIVRCADWVGRLLVFGEGAREAVGRAREMASAIDGALLASVVGAAEEEWRARSAPLEGWAGRCLSQAEVRARAREALAEVSLAAEQENQAMRRRQGELLRRVMTDSLTGVKNRLAFDERLVEEFERSQRSGKAMALLLCDLDHFKRFNDLHGHQAGDQMLRSAAKALAQAARRVDIVARYGGEEFAVIAPDCAREGAAALAERLRGAVEGARAEWRGEVLRCTISIGGAVLAAGESGRRAGELLAEADRLLYAAKGAGRNRCLVEMVGGRAVPARSG